MVDTLAHTPSDASATQDFVPPATGLAANNIGKAYRGRVVVKDITLTVGGERRRVEIARALASRPSFMLLDEPFTGIDPIAIADISELILYLKKRGIGILITDHRVRETLDIVDRASILFQGEALFEGTPEEIRANKDVRRVYLGEKYA